MVMTESRDIVLALETSGTTGGAALLDGRLLLGSLSFTSRALYSQRLLPAVEWLLERAEVSLERVGAVGVSRGPGSFTGLRVGLSAAKGLAYATGAALVGVPTLEALALRAAGVAGGGPVCPVLDARQGMVFAALFRLEEAAGAVARLVRLREDFAGAAAEVAGWIEGPTVFLGEGALRYADEFATLLGDRFVLAPPHRRLPSAEEVAVLALERWRRGDTDDPAGLVPEYVARSYMERTRPDIR
jgi:tRNA threonylcarbamoyladenosine biosynthesis protein TsaB